MPSWKNCVLFVWFCPCCFNYLTIYFEFTACKMFLQCLKWLVATLGSIATVRLMLQIVPNKLLRAVHCSWKQLFDLSLYISYSRNFVENVNKLACVAHCDGCQMKIKKLVVYLLRHRFSIHIPTILDNLDYFIMKSLNLFIQTSRADKVTYHWIYTYVGFEVLRTVVMKSSIFWDIMPCNLLKVSQCFRGTCCHHLQGQRISQAIRFLAWLIFRPWGWSWHVPL
jgi:hypothetical protein